MNKYFKRISCIALILFIISSIAFADVLFPEPKYNESGEIIGYHQYSHSGLQRREETPQYIISHILLYVGLVCAGVFTCYLILFMVNKEKYKKKVKIWFLVLIVIIIISVLYALCNYIYDSIYNPGIFD